MYRYDALDKEIVLQRAAQFRDQVRRRLSGEITEDEFKPLRLQNGLYMQLHSYMLRVAIPYGCLTSAQVRHLAHVARKYDRGYAHFTTRQNVQYNWPKLHEVPDLLEGLAHVEMHAIQTSGNCVRNISSDPFAGVAADELEDPRPYCEILRQYSTFHPEFANLPRKFKIAITGAADDRAAIAFHDIGIRLVENLHGERGFEIWVGGGQGRTPMVAERIREFLPKSELLSYTEAILRIYNRYGRRDNKYKARIKILVGSLGADAFRDQVEAEWDLIRSENLQLDDAELARMATFFEPPAYDAEVSGVEAIEAPLLMDPDFRRWYDTNVFEHRQPGYAIVVASLKNGELPPGDATAPQLDAFADLADQYALGRVVVTHRQNLVIPDVRIQDLHAVWTGLKALGWAVPNVNQLSDIIACPGLDYCSLANARSIDVAQMISQRFNNDPELSALGDLTLNISGCINACGHHHVGHIGILGINKMGVEAYQLMLGGSSATDASLGKFLGRALDKSQIVEAVERVARCYLQIRRDADERFLDTYRRVGPDPFKAAVYSDDTQWRAA